MKRFNGLWMLDFPECHIVLENEKDKVPLYTFPTIPPHLALVPREPTKEMLSAGRTADHEWQEIDTPDEVYEGGLASIYKDMLTSWEKQSCAKS